MAKLKIGEPLLAMLVVALAGCQDPIKSFSKVEPDASFGTYRTFAWIEDHPMRIAGSKPGDVGPLLEGRIKKAIVAALDARGYVLVPDRKSADLVFSFVVGVEDKAGFVTAPVPNYYAYRGGAWQSATGSVYRRSVYIPRRGYKTQYRKGTLTVVAVDFAKKKAVWHGTATKALEYYEKRRQEKNVHDAAEKIFKDFPPAPPR
jgi:hypothetical protein